MPSNPEVRLNRSMVFILAGMAVLSAGVYLLSSRLYFRIGFPLDDAWIHQTYARNLALRAEWAFLPGRPSAGSTAPLWSALLSIGYLLRLAPYAWTYALGIAALWATAVLAEIGVRSLGPGYRPSFPWAGAVCTLEWHLVWAAVSGMETMLYALLVLAVVVLLLAGPRNHFRLGLLIGICVWVRPDGITLLFAPVLAILLQDNSWKNRFWALVNLAVGCGGLVALYLLFNLALAGSPLPNTFFAKQAEYAILQQIPFWKRFLGEALQPLVGVGIILLPGVWLSLVSAVHRRSWVTLACLAWFVGYIGLYAWRLPVTYQHARYVIPAMTVWFVLGFSGLVEFAARRYSPRHRLIAIGSELTMVLVLLIFWGRGAYAYAQDVAVIESEMVTTARWVSANLPPNALVAAHDIGALGYFGGHDLVDLAGLVSPEVIPFLRDEKRIAAYLDKNRVDYLVTFPSWYPTLTQGLQPIFTTGAPYAPAMGTDNMAVYSWPGH